MSNGYVITIDPGHGNGPTTYDKGAIGYSRNTYESKNVMDTSLTLKFKLEQQGFKVLLTRTSDNIYPSWSDRASIGNKADLYISIHNNSYSDVNSNGYETLVKADQSSGTKLKIEKIHKHTVKATGLVDRGIKPRTDLRLLNDAKVPVCILELGFISSRTEEALLCKKQWQLDVCDAIVKGVCEAFSLPYDSGNSPKEYTVTISKRDFISNGKTYNGLETVNIEGSLFIKFRDLDVLPEVGIDYQNNTPIINIK